MPTAHRFALLLIVETANPDLAEERLEAALSEMTPQSLSRVRRQILKCLPQDVRRVAAVFPVEHAKLLLQLHEAIGEDLRQDLREAGFDPPQLFTRPPPSYVPPGQE